MFPTTDNECTMAGWVEYLAVSDGGDLHISVAPGTDLDDTFDAYCHDTGERLRVNGWLFTFEPIDPDEFGGRNNRNAS